MEKGRPEQRGKIGLNLRFLWREHWRIVLSYLLFAASWMIVGLFVQGYGTSSHLLYLLQLTGFLGIVAAGQTLVILIGGIDLSVGSVITFAGIMTTQLMAGTDWGLGAALAVALLGSALVGAFNGLGVSLMGVPPLVMTLATSSILQGVVLVITKGTPQAANAPGFSRFVNEPVLLGLNGINVTWLVVTVVMLVLLAKTTFGKKIYYLGSGPVAFRYAGYKPFPTIVAVYALSSLMSGLTGILLVGYTGQSYLDMGSAYQMLSIAAVILGGTSILGGKGGYTGTIAGALLLTLIQSVLVLFKISTGGKMAVQGLLILLLVILYGRESKQS